MFEKSMPIFHRILAIFAIVASCVYFAITMLEIMNGKHDFEAVVTVIFTGLCILISVLWVWLSFQIKYKEYHYNDKLITIYAGFVRHTFRVDGKLVSKHNQWLTNVDAELSGLVDDKSRLAVRIQPLNLISLKMYTKKQ